MWRMARGFFTTTTHHRRHHYHQTHHHHRRHRRHRRRRPSTYLVGPTKPKPFERKRANLTAIKQGKMPPLSAMRDLAVERHNGPEKPMSSEFSRRKVINSTLMLVRCDWLAGWLLVDCVDFPIIPTPLTAPTSPLPSLHLTACM